MAPVVVAVVMVIAMMLVVAVMGEGRRERLQNMS
jgi:hypothetical protein